MTTTTRKTVVRILMESPIWQRLRTWQRLQAVRHYEKTMDDVGKLLLAHP